MTTSEQTGATSNLLNRGGETSLPGIKQLGGITRVNEPQLPAEGPVVPAPVHEPPITIIAAFSRILKNHLDVADEIQTIHHELRTHAPGGFQAEELSAILERRHGGPQMGLILESLRAERERSPYFQEI